MTDQPTSPEVPSSIAWLADHGGSIRLLDQRALPQSVSFLSVTTLEQLREAILALAVRGAPAIGIAAAYGIAMHAARMADAAGPGAPSDDISDAIEHACQRLRSSRPTAVNLMWAVDRCRDCFDHHSAQLSARQSAARLLLEARMIHREDAALCAEIAANGSPLLREAAGILTHCHTGALATGGIGTALGCIRAAHADGAQFTVFAGETRPLLQGARLTAWELQQLNIPVRLHTDGMAGYLMASGAIDAVIVGADRVTAAGDVANKIGTYQLAILARHHDIPFYVAAPSSTFDLSIDHGSSITIEQRDPDEVRCPAGVAFGPPDVAVSNPAFDITPASLISAIITERGVIQPVERPRIIDLMNSPDAPPAI